MDCRLNGPLCGGGSVGGFLLEKPTQKQHSKPFRGSTSFRPNHFGAQQVFAQTISGLNKFSPKPFRGSIIENLVESLKKVG